ncbi:MAG: Asp-tRNA(Asn)/Glu-tRNA(Gln) amidotransferase subunit GatA [Alphaproteobacteria bacterium]|jgi:aspartyl-tRNA(Asn)/glutamyl-tRNA(Gln) amidotransferase subunit A|nr:Asp-tRNA(Asn)/Glu-tRNA(Gln) amidotransferase subunit GatA [Alphaproteobacteria bacterium]
MSKITDLTATELKAELDKKNISPVEVTEDYIAAAQRGQEATNAFILTTFDQAREAARQSEARYAAGTARTMDGLPIAMKDLYCTKGIQTTAASRILEGFVPQYESTVSQKLADAGCITLGKANLDEFAMGSGNITSAYGNVISPWSGKDPANAARKLIPGGSSGGTAAAVAGRFAVAGTGTDTGGSIRFPAAITGIVGIKPTYGRCSRYGIIAYASSLDQAGPMTRSVGDAALMLREMAGYDPKDSTSVNTPVPDYMEALGKSVKGLRVGLPREYRLDGMPAETIGVWDKGAQMLRDAGAEVVDISLPHTKYALPTYYIIAPAEASSNLARYDGVRFGQRKEGIDLADMYEKTRGAGFGAEVRRRILMGTYVLSAGYYDAYYRKAQRVRRLIREDFIKAFNVCDVILTPPATSTAFGIGENNNDPIQMYLTDVFTVTLNLAGLPGIVVPMQLCADGLPMGLQLIGKPFDEMTLFTAASALEKEAGFNAVPPFVG